MPKYLMFDHGGVLNGGMSFEPPQKNDLVIADLGGIYQVLKNATDIITHINVLVNDYGYQVVYHSKNKEAEQLDIHNKIVDFCKINNIAMPPITAMAVKDAEAYAGFTSNNCKKIENTPHGIRIAGYATDDNEQGKSDVRKALSRLLGDIDIARSVVFDDGPSIIPVAQQEGYQATRVGMEEDCLDLCTQLQKIIEQEKALVNEQEALQRVAPFRFLNGACETFNPEFSDLSETLSSFSDRINMELKNSNLPENSIRLIYTIDSLQFYFNSMTLNDFKNQHGKVTIVLKEGLTNSLVQELITDVAKRSPLAQAPVTEDNPVGLGGGGGSNTHDDNTDSTPADLISKLGLLSSVPTTKTALKYQDLSPAMQEAIADSDQLEECSIENGAHIDPSDYFNNHLTPKDQESLLAELNQSTQLDKK